MAIDHSQHLCMGRGHRLALSCEKRYDGIPVSKTTKRQFTDNKWVAKQAVILDDFA